MPKRAVRVALASSCTATVYGPCRCSTATRELRGRGYQFMRCNIFGTRALDPQPRRRGVGAAGESGERVVRGGSGGRVVPRRWIEAPGEALGVVERRVPCKTVLEVNDNLGRRIPDRLTFEPKEPRA